MEFNYDLEELKSRDNVENRDMLLRSKLVNPRYRHLAEIFLLVSKFQPIDRKGISLKLSEYFHRTGGTAKNLNNHLDTLCNDGILQYIGYLDARKRDDPRCISIKQKHTLKTRGYPPHMVRNMELTRYYYVSDTGERIASFVAERVFNLGGEAFGRQPK